MSSPTQRTLAWLREQYEMVQVVERWQAQSRKRIDLFGFGDILVCTGQHNIMVQATSTGNLSARLDKMKGERYNEVRTWLTVPCNQLIAIGWKKYAKPIDRKYWRPTIYDAVMDDYSIDFEKRKED